MAERVGFEPTLEFPLNTLSKRAPSTTRPSLLVSPVAAAACSRPKAQRFFGYCFVANRDSRSIGVVDLTRFRTRRQIALDAAPSQVLARPKTTQAYVLDRKSVV